MRNILQLFVLLLSCNIYSQQSGFEYAVTGNNIDYYVRIESDIDSSMGLYSNFWLKYDTPAKKIKTKSGKYINSGGGYTLAYMTISCYNKSHQTKNIIRYNKSGNVIGRDDIPTFDKPIVPGSVVEGIYNKVCNKN